MDGQPSWGGAPLAACSPGDNEVAIYEDPDYRGRCVVRGPGTYDDASRFAPLPDNSASSIRVGRNVTALLATGARIGGETEKFFSSDRDLFDNPGRRDRRQHDVILQGRPLAGLHGARRLDLLG
jgi:hypothetical protein